MVRNQETDSDDSQKGKGVKRKHEEGGKYARYTQEQLEVLEKVYTQCPNPTHLQRLQIMREQPTLSGIDLKQLKVWFQNRRCREKQKKENCDLMSENRQLTAANKLLREENDNLQKKMNQLICENENMRTQVIILTSASTSDIRRQPEASNPQPQMPIRISDNKCRLLAEETKEEFLSKAIGNAVDWTPASGLQLNTIRSVGELFVSTGDGAAARANVTIPSDPVKTIEILKDKPAWCRSCRTMDVKYSVNDGGTIELVYTQYYAPTITACARDFWTLRYTCVLDDGSYVVCEKSISSCDAGLTSPAALDFVRGKMLASGYLVRPVEGGSSLCLVHHFDMEASSVLEEVQPLYESSELVAKKMIVAALHYIEHMMGDKNGKQAQVSREDPSFLRSFSQRLCRGFDDAVNCFSEDGWTLMNGDDASDDIYMSIKQMKNVGAVYANFDSVICAKASFSLQNDHPASLVRVLKDRRIAWMDFNFTDHLVAFSKAAYFAYPGPNIHQFSETSVVLGPTDYGDEAFEVVRFGRAADNQNNINSGDLYHFQILKGLEDSGIGSCAELIFAPIDRNTPDNATLLSSGFRILFLGPTAGTMSNMALNSRNAQASVSHTASLLILAFQFPFESHLREDVVSMVRQYVQHVISSVKNLSHEVMQSESKPNMRSLVANPAPEIALESSSLITLTNLIYQGYRSMLGVDMIGFKDKSAKSNFEQMHQHQYAILCFSLTALPLCFYANRSALLMLDMTPDNLKNLTIDEVLGGSKSNLSLVSILPTIRQQGYAILSPGHCLLMSNRYVSYRQAVAWQVQAPQGSPIQSNCLALAFMGLSFN